MLCRSSALLSQQQSSRILTRHNIHNSNLLLSSFLLPSTSTSKATTTTLVTPILQSSKRFGVTANPYTPEQYQKRIAALEEQLRVRDNIIREYMSNSLIPNGGGNSGNNFDSVQNPHNPDCGRFVCSTGSEIAAAVANGANHILLDAEKMSNQIVFLPCELTVQGDHVLMVETLQSFIHVRSGAAAMEANNNNNSISSSSVLNGVTQNGHHHQNGSSTSNGENGLNGHHHNHVNGASTSSDASSSGAGAIINTAKPSPTTPPPPAGSRRPGARKKHHHNTFLSSDQRKEIVINAATRVKIVGNWKLSNRVKFHAHDIDFSGDDRESESLFMLTSGASLVLHNCYLGDAREAVYLSSTTHATLTQCVVCNNVRGIFESFRSACRLIGCEFDENYFHAVLLSKDANAAAAALLAPGDREKARQPQKCRLQQLLSLGNEFYCSPNPKYSITRADPKVVRGDVCFQYNPMLDLYEDVFLKGGKTVLRDSEATTGLVDDSW